MSVSTVRSVAVLGVTARIVGIEVDLGAGLPGLSLVGLPDTSVSEARDRVRAAIGNSGLPWPGQRVTVNLTPAGIHKRGTGFDLALATGLLMAQGRIRADQVARTVLVAELGLDGSARPVPGIVVAALACRRAGIDRLMVAAEDAERAAVVTGVTIVGVRSLRHLVAVLTGGAEPAVAAPCRRPRPAGPDLRDVAGQSEARLALEVAAAGGHHLSLIGPPGAGKTMLAARLPGLLPDLDDEAALEVTAIHSLVGDVEPGLIERPPYVAPHHTASVAAVVGGGSGLPRPGAISLAHRGVLFLDEAPEFRGGVLDALRQPLEQGAVHLSRSAGSVTWPARFQLVLAANPCPCGRFGSTEQTCACSPMQVRRYASRLSGPLLDRVDLHLAVRPVPREALLGDPEPEPSATVAARVATARAAAAARWSRQGWLLNAEIPGAALRGAFRPPREAMAPVARALDDGRVTARGLDRVLRIAWTLADLQGRQVPGRTQVAAALRFRAAEQAVAA